MQEVKVAGKQNNSGETGEVTHQDLERCAGDKGEGDRASFQANTGYFYLEGPADHTDWRVW